jgi:hypothetical protein
VDSRNGSEGKTLGSGVDLGTYARLDGSMLNRRGTLFVFILFPVADGWARHAVSCTSGAALGWWAQVYHVWRCCTIGAGSSVYASIHDVSVEAFVRFDLLHSYMRTRFICVNHFVSLIIAHQRILACDTGTRK